MTRLVTPPSSTRINSLATRYEIVQRYLPKNFFVLNTKLTEARNAFNSAVARLEANAEAVAAVGGARVEQGE